MAETIQNLFDKVRALLDEYTDDGVMIPDADIVDMQKKSIPLFDMVHKELYEQCRLDPLVSEPTTLTALTNAAQVNYKASQAMVYYVSARLACYGKQSLVPYFESKFEELKRTCSNKATEVAITDAYAPAEVE